MAAEILADPNQSNPPDYVGAQERVLHVVRAAAETSRDIPAEKRQLTDSFCAAALDKIGVDPRRMNAAQSPEVARFAHEHITDLVRRRAAVVDQLQRRYADEGRIPFLPPGPVRLIPDAPVARRREGYFTTFGTNWQSKPPELMAEEQAHLALGIKRALAKVVVGGRPDIDGYQRIARFVPRPVDYPQISLAIQLNQVFQHEQQIHPGAVHAAHSLQVLVACYGDWFPTQLLGKRATVVDNPYLGKPNTIVVPADEIPDKPRAQRSRRAMPTPQAPKPRDGG